MNPVFITGNLYYKFLACNMKIKNNYVSIVYPNGDRAFRHIESMFIPELAEFLMKYKTSEENNDRNRSK
jgi:ABC-type Fe3+ transport system substrate-binding protein